MLQRVCRRKPGQSFRQSFGLIIDRWALTWALRLYMFIWWQGRWHLKHACFVIRVWGEGQDEIFGLRGDPLLVNANEKLDGRPSGFGHLGLRFERGYAKTAKSSMYYCASYCTILTHGIVNINLFLFAGQSRKTTNEEPFSDANDIDMDQFQG